MRKYLAGLVAAACFLVVSHSARSTSVGVYSEAPGVLLPSLTSATVLTFDDLPVGSLPVYRFSGGMLSGSGAIEDTSVAGEFAQPAGDATGFLTVSYPYPSAAVDLVFTSPENYFGLYWGSMDSYNSVTFLKNREQIATYSGTDIAGWTGLVANGQQQSAWSNRFIEYNFDAGLYDEVILSTNDLGFEVDNIAFGDPPTPISEPDTLMILSCSLFGLTLVRRMGIGGECSALSRNCARPQRSRSALQDFRQCPSIRHRRWSMVRFPSIIAPRCRLWTAAARVYAH